jgi:hypothetical protein
MTLEVGLPARRRERRTHVLIPAGGRGPRIPLETEVTLAGASSRIGAGVKNGRRDATTIARASAIRRAERARRRGGFAGLAAPRTSAQTVIVMTKSIGRTMWSERLPSLLIQMEMVSSVRAARSWFDAPKMRHAAHAADVKKKAGTTSVSAVAVKRSIARPVRRSDSSWRR